MYRKYFVSDFPLYKIFCGKLSLNFKMQFSAGYPKPGYVCCRTNHKFAVDSSFQEYFCMIQLMTYSSYICGHALFLYLYQNDFKNIQRKYLGKISILSL